MHSLLLLWVVVKTMTVLTRFIRHHTGCMDKVAYHEY
jgi:hypothetical protein